MSCSIEGTCVSATDSAHPLCAVHFIVEVYDMMVGANGLFTWLRDIPLHGEGKESESESKRNSAQSHNRLQCNIICPFSHTTPRSRSRTLNQLRCGGQFRPPGKASPSSDGGRDRIVVGNGHDAAVGHVPHQDLLVLRYPSRAEQAVVVREGDEGHAVIVFRQPVHHCSLAKAPHDHVRVLSSLAGRDETAPVFRTTDTK